eukprot:360046-Chlamydomonas_euryale.AAC.5
MVVSKACDVAGCAAHNRRRPSLPQRDHSPVSQCQGQKGRLISSSLTHHAREHRLTRLWEGG